jgi:hypothetical protein
MSQNPSQIVVTDKGNYIVHFRDGFTGGGAHPMARGGGAIFHDKAKNIRDKMRYSNLSNNMMISEL